jgi:hypothetical protein
MLICIHGRTDELLCSFAGLPPSHPVVNLDDYDSVASFARRIVKASTIPPYLTRQAQQN